MIPETEERSSKEHLINEPFSQPTTKTVLSSHENDKQVPEEELSKKIVERERDSPPNSALLLAILKLLGILADLKDSP